ncbi:DUF6506 family protein [Lachnospiraceae bacterium 54-53]
MVFAFIIMGQFDSQRDRAVIHNGMAQIAGVSDINEACTVAKELYTKGVTCIELCGAFGEEGAKAVIEATQNKIPIGYVTHLPEQDEVYKLAFSK